MVCRVGFVIVIVQRVRPGSDALVMFSVHYRLLVTPPFRCQVFVVRLAAFHAVCHAVGYRVAFGCVHFEAFWMTVSFSYPGKYFSYTTMHY